VLEVRRGNARSDEMLSDPLCDRPFLETLGTRSEDLVGAEAIARAEAGHAGWCAEILRANAAVMLKQGALDAAAAETRFRRSLDIAHQQGSLSWELRAATSLARLWRDQGRVCDAHDLLASVYARFTEGFGTADLVTARALLHELVSRSDSHLIRASGPGRNLMSPQAQPNLSVPDGARARSVSETRIARFCHALDTKSAATLSPGHSTVRQVDQSDARLSNWPRGTPEKDAHSRFWITCRSQQPHLQSHYCRDVERAGRKVSLAACRSFYDALRSY
jgi:hypothetical protein